MKLSKEDFNKIDELLVKIGFGSYYDCIELLKNAIYNLEPESIYVLKQETDLLKIVVLINRLTKKIKREK